MDIEHSVMNAIDKQLERLPYITATVEVVLTGKTLKCEYTKNKPIKGFAENVKETESKHKNSNRI